MIKVKKILNFVEHMPDDKEPEESKESGEDDTDQDDNTEESGNDGTDYKLKKLVLKTGETGDYTITYGTNRTYNTNQ